ncbi:MAG: FHA domain-containing protein [Selenomonadales bacterium]|nr:FHA domain-containing protein [Selenomonadales bacterium]MDD7763386.1 FHA domain-containing protein [Selenomonadales bacterium]
MPATAMLIKIARVLLEYGMLFWLLWFSLKLSKNIFKEIRRENIRQRAPETSQNEAVLSVIAAEEESLQGRRYAFVQQITIGRGEENDIVIPENFVSHHHAVIYQHGNQYVIEDLGSVNHTYVNGNALSGKSYIKPGDEVQIGMVVLRFER